MNTTTTTWILFIICYYYSSTLILIESYNNALTNKNSSCRPHIISFKDIDDKVTDVLLSKWLETRIPEYEKISNSVESKPEEDHKKCQILMVERLPNCIKKYMDNNNNRHKPKRSKSSNVRRNLHKPRGYVIYDENTGLEHRHHRNKRGFFDPVKNAWRSFNHNVIKFFGGKPQKQPITNNNNNNQEPTIYTPPMELNILHEESLSNSDSGSLDDKNVRSTLELLENIMKNDKMDEIGNGSGGFLYNLSRELLDDLKNCRGMQNCYEDLRSKLKEAESKLIEYNLVKYKGQHRNAQISISTITSTLDFIFRFLDVLTNCQGLENCHTKFRKLVIDENSLFGKEPNFMAEIRRSLIEIIAVAFETEIGRSIKSVITEWYRAGKNFLHIFNPSPDSDENQEPIEKDVALSVIDQVYRSSPSNTSQSRSSSNEGKEFDVWFQSSPDNSNNAYPSLNELNADSLNIPNSINSPGFLKRQKRASKKSKKSTGKHTLKFHCESLDNIPKHCGLKDPKVKGKILNDISKVFGKNWPIYETQMVKLDETNIYSYMLDYKILGKRESLAIHFSNDDPVDIINLIINNITLKSKLFKL